ncbi:MAG: Rne/Rng family ribonuclease [Bacteroidales bacterium]|nr:Rne/Rng family ribonuclease [Bacteroidales bacterium]
MDRSLIIDTRETETEIALLEDNQLVELHKQKNNLSFAVGDIFLGKIKKVMPGLNAAFVDIGSDKDAFLHYLDLGPQAASLLKFTRWITTNRSQGLTVSKMELEPEIQKNGKLETLLSSQQMVMVQIAKEPISTKGARLTSEVSIAGRYLVLVPFYNKVNVSQKIKSKEERNRLKRVVDDIKPQNFGVIIRTNAEHKMSEEIESDMKVLLQKWANIVAKLKDANPVKKLYSELERSTAILRDVVNDSFNNIVTNSQDLTDELRQYMQTISPEHLDIVKTYKGKQPIFEFYNIDRQIKTAFSRIVSIKNGVYIIIEQTEAMHVIDVNSGNRYKNSEDQDENVLEINMEAATEIARQLRLRDIGGIIVVDFIDMRKNVHNKQLFDHLCEVMSKDTTRHTILPVSKFGLIQITRQRVRPATTIQVVEKCPICHGTGEITPSILITEEIENNIRYLIHEQNELSLLVSVHPIIYAYLTKGLFYKFLKWKSKYKWRIHLSQNPSYNLTEYHFFNKQAEEIHIY